MSNTDGRMTFTEHLGELRTRIIRSLIALVAGFVLCYACYEPIFEIISRPLRPLQAMQAVAPDTPVPDGETAASASSESEPGESKKETKKIQWLYLSLFEPILIRMKLSANGALVLALPFIIYQLCAFVFPGLTARERKLSLTLLLGSGSLVVVGVSVAYFAVFPLVGPYLLDYALPGVSVELRMSETIPQILGFLLGFAAAFQFPMVVLVLVYMGLLSPATLKKFRRHAIVGIAVIAALFTPPDPFSMVIMLIPLVLLYEVSIWLSYLVVRSRERAAKAD